MVTSKRERYDTTLIEDDVPIIQCGGPFRKTRCTRQYPLVLIRVFCRSTLSRSHRHRSIPKVPVHPAVTAHPASRLTHPAQVPSLAHVQSDSRSDFKGLALLFKVLLQTFCQEHQGSTCVEECFSGGDVREVFGVRVGRYAKLDLVIERMRDPVTGKGDIRVEEKLSRSSNR